MSNLKSQKRKLRIRGKLAGATNRARLTVFRSNKYIYSQVVDDSKHVTIASAWGKNASEVGKKIAQKSLEVKVSDVVFDRSGYKYHGNVKLLADSAREAGLKF